LALASGTRLGPWQTLSAIGQTDVESLRGFTSFDDLMKPKG
jgi:hypothetical protein